MLLFVSKKLHLLLAVRMRTPKPLLGTLGVPTPLLGTLRVPTPAPVARVSMARMSIARVSIARVSMARGAQVPKNNSVKNGD